MNRRSKPVSIRACCTAMIVLAMPLLGALRAEAGPQLRIITAAPARPMNPKAVRSDVSGFAITYPPTGYNGYYINTYRFATFNAINAAQNNLGYFVAATDLYSDGMQCPTFGYQNDINLGPTCEILPGPGIISPSPTYEAYTSDYFVGELIYIQNAINDEMFYFTATDPNGKPYTGPAYIFNGSEFQGILPPGVSCTGAGTPIDCCTGAGADNCSNVTFGDSSGTTLLFVGPEGPCLTTGPNPWHIDFYDDGGTGTLTDTFPNQFLVARDSTSPLEITSPAFNQLFQLTESDYTTTGNVPFTAHTNGGGSINWYSTLSYASSSGKGASQRPEGVYHGKRPRAR